MPFFDGLTLFEIIMLGAGTLLFLVILILLIVFAIRGKSIGSLFYFFVLSIVMIGFPAISKFKISTDGVELEKNTDSLLQNPTDKTTRENVASAVARLSSRPFGDPANLTQLAKAQIALGDNATADQNVQKALQVAPQDAAALQLKKRLLLDRDLEQLTSMVEKDTNDQAAKGQLAQVVAEASKIPIASPVTTVNLARAHAALGNQAQAIESTKIALQINPTLQDAIALQDRLKDSVARPAAEAQVK
jgi:tetratricopeptide (TPR) repeat protein